MIRSSHRRPSSGIVPGILATLALSGAADAQERDGAGQAAPTSARAIVAPIEGTATDSADVAATVRRYHEALARGDSAAALALLAPDALVLESGGLETVAEYRAHHLASDIEFARAVAETRSAIRATVRGDVAWTAYASTASGSFRGRAVNSAGAELMVLTRTRQGWRIAAIHWSSRRRN